MHEIDSTFSKDRRRHIEKKRRQRVRGAVGLAIFGTLVAGIGLGTAIWLDSSGTESEDVEALQDFELVQQETVPVALPAYVPTIIDLPGDPIRIELGRSADSSALRSVPVPVALTTQGFTGELFVLSQDLVETGEHLTVALPSTQQDFAFFQSQRVAAETSTAILEAEAKPEPVSLDLEGTDGSAGDDLIADGAEAGEGGWEVLGDEEALPAEKAPEEELPKTEIADNVSTIELIPERYRAPVTDDSFVRVIASIDLKEFLLEKRLDAGDVDLVRKVAEESFGLTMLEAGSVVATRQTRARAGVPSKLVQIALYRPETFVGALARSGEVFRESVDPWVSHKLTEFDREPASTARTAQSFRLLDGIFSTATRNGVSSGIVGEAIMHLSRSYDLNDLANDDDRLTLVYSEAPRGGDENAARVLYVALQRKGSTLRCFVYRPSGADEYRCLDEFDVTDEIETANGMTTPIAGGVMTSRFGPRQHPILKKVLMHKGVDWAAPTGTPVRAAFDGAVTFAGDAGGYGNLIKLAHGGKRETYYAHLNAFAPAARPGAKVRAGDVIGYVGTTGRSTGPHLHFEMHLAGSAIDPLGDMRTASLQPGVSAGAVEKLVDRIVHVESGGNARAKNPLSTATGLGQFIDSTWLRMMRTYRPDLVSSLSREELLALRFDPTLSREAVTWLARENKAYLEARGHTVSPGRLYLAHFLGPEGARKVLSASDGDDLGVLLGDGVINANGFLRGHNVAFIKDWADRKMSGRAPSRAAPVVVKKKIERASPEFKLYRETLISLVSA